MFTVLDDSVKETLSGKREKIEATDRVNELAETLASSKFGKVVFVGLVPYDKKKKNSDFDEKGAILPKVRREFRGVGSVLSKKHNFGRKNENKEKNWDYVNIRVNEHTEKGISGLVFFFETAAKPSVIARDNAKQKTEKPKRTRTRTPKDVTPSETPPSENPAS